MKAFVRVVLLWLTLTLSAAAYESRSGYLVGVQELSNFGYFTYVEQTINIGPIDLTRLPVPPDYVVAVAEAQVGIANSCTAIEVTLNTYNGSFTGVSRQGEGGLDGTFDCEVNGGGNQKSQRTYTTASVTADLTPGQTSLPLAVTFKFGGNNQGASNVTLRKVRLSFYSYNPPNFASTGVRLLPEAFAALGTDPKFKSLFGGLLVNLDNQQYQIKLTDSGLVAQSPIGTAITAQQIQFYLPENSLYQSRLLYQSDTGQPFLSLAGVNGAGVVSNPAVYGNPIQLAALGLREVTGLRGYLVAYPRPATLSAFVKESAVKSGTSVTVYLAASGIDPATLKLSIRGSSVQEQSLNDPQKSDLVYKGRTTVSLTLSGNTGQSLPVVITARKVDSDQEITNSFVVTMR